jgi:molybdopterin/thiamine biosynthesis adenylyltransferase
MRVMQRVPGVNVTVHVGMIQDKPAEFYDQFVLFILGLDSIEARRYMNGIACSCLGELSLSWAGAGWPWILTPLLSQKF